MEDLLEDLLGRLDLSLGLTGAEIPKKEPEKFFSPAAEDIAAL